MALLGITESMLATTRSVGVPWALRTTLPALTAAWNWKPGLDGRLMVAKLPLSEGAASVRLPPAASVRALSPAVRRLLTT